MIKEVKFIDLRKGLKPINLVGQISFKYS